MPRTRRSLTTCALASTLVALGACSGGDEALPTTTSTTTSTSTTTTTIAAAPEPVFRSLQGFLAAFTAVAATGATQGAEFVLDEDVMTTGPIVAGGALPEAALGGGTTGFISVEHLPGAALGGVMDDATGVTTVFVLVDPQNPSAAPIVLSLLASTIASNAEFDQGEFATAYRELAADAANRVGEQIWFPSTNGGGHSLVATVIEGSPGSNDLIEVAIVPVGDEALALASVKPIRNAVFALVA